MCSAATYFAVAADATDGTESAMSVRFEDDLTIGFDVWS
jgi:hypothetical protein